MLYHSRIALQFINSVHRTLILALVLVHLVLQLLNICMVRLKLHLAGLALLLKPGLHLPVSVDPDLADKRAGQFMHDFGTDMP